MDGWSSSLTSGIGATGFNWRSIAPSGLSYSTTVGATSLAQCMSNAIKFSSVKLFLKL